MPTQFQTSRANQAPKVESRIPVDSFAAKVPSLSLPKGGGAIRGIGEKFATNPATGTGAMAISIPLSPGRANFSPQLSLTYDSGKGNGPFGLGWSLTLPSITRKTDKGLPQYDDEKETDTFILSGTEDLVPEFKKNDSGEWVTDSTGNLQRYEELREVNGVQYRVCRYRPRTEGVFSRIERWIRTNDGDTHWRSISKDNVTTLYGKRDAKTNDARVESRIADPIAPTRVFSWLICESYDDKGNAISYRYVADDDSGVDISSAHEANRTTASRTSNRYLKRVFYGNVSSLVSSEEAISPLGPDLSTMKWHFEAVFDYGEGHITKVSTTNPKGELVTASLIPTRSWRAREDAFSTSRPTFEVRTYRRCERIALFHHFENELPTPDCLVRSLDLDYLVTGITSYLTSVTSSGYVFQADSNYLRKSLPPLEFEYSRSPLEEFASNEFPIFDLLPESLENVPAGTSDGRYQWVDIDGEGISGLLSEQSGAWYFKENLGNARLGGLQLLSPQPSFVAIENRLQRLLDLAGDGQLDLVSFAGPAAGFYERTEDNKWEPFRSFLQLPSLDWGDSQLRFTDLTGDGLSDILITEREEVT